MASPHFQNPDALNGVHAFHTLYQVPAQNEPVIPDRKRCDLRVALIQEELNELKQAIEDNNIVEVADALADLQYVLSGAVLEFGMGSRFKAIFDEVQRSNLSKACASLAEAEQTIAHYAEKGTLCHWEQQNDGQYVVYRTADRKVLKSVQYSPPDIAPILQSPQAA
jgi:predicted HAD superfamily Cof-like phosphohydrolase